MFFRVEFLVTEQRLGRALAALAGVAQGQPNIRPVTNVIEGGDGQLRQVSKDSSHLDQFAEALKQSHKPGDLFTSMQAKDFLRSIGASENSYSYLIGNAIERKLLKKNPPKGNSTKTGYTVLKQAE